MAGLVNNESYSQYYRKLGVIYQRPEIKASMEVIFSVFMVGVLIFIAIRPTLTNIASLQKKITDKESVSTKADKKIGQLFNAQEQLNLNVDSLSLYDTAVSENFSYLDMVARIELVAKSTGSEIEQLSAPGISLNGEGKPAGDWQSRIIKKDEKNLLTIPLDFQITGKPTQIKEFLIQIEKMDKLAMIKNVNLSKESGTTKGSEKIKANGQLLFYAYLPTPKK